MDEYEAYFDPISDEVLESLNEFEQNASKTPEERPAKRQKLHHPGPDSFELDELPEISVQNNFYSTEIDPLVSERNNRPPTITRNSRINANLRPQSAIRNSWNTRHSSTPSLASVQLNSGTGPSSSTPHPRQANSQRSASRLAIIASALASSETPTSIPTPLHEAVIGPDPSASQSDALKKKLDEMDKEITRIRNLLREAQDARFAKEGEATVLRQNMDKATKQHLDQVAKLRAAKEEADLRQMNMQREMKAELARLRSELAFKQTEAEAHSLRRPPASVRKKATQRSPSQPPPQTPATAGRVINNDSPDTSIFRTPIRSPPRVNRYARSPEVARKTFSLPGFVNAFDQSNFGQPVQIHSKPVPKATQDAQNDNPFIVNDQSESGPLPIPALNTSPATEHHNDIQFDELPDIALDPGHKIDQEMEDAQSETSDGEESVYGVPTPQFYSNAELTRIVLTHTHVVAKLPTLQFLVESSASKRGYKSAENLSSSITHILEVLANTSGNFGYEYNISVLNRCIVTILDILRVNNLIAPLISVLNLLTVLLRSFPDLHVSLLSCPESENEDRSKITILLSQIIIQHLNLPTAHNVFETLAFETFTLLETLIWNVPQNLVPKLSVFCCNRELPSILFLATQSHSFLSYSTRFLALLFSHPKMYEHCVASITETTEDGNLLDFGRTVNLDRLCSLLIDVSRSDPDATNMKNHILMFFTALSVADPNALNLLARSQVFIPSLVTHIAYLARPIWEEEDEESLDSQFRPASLTIRALNKTLSLLHHVVFNATPPVNLPDKFLRAHARAFNGINHSFIVAFGRLSCAGAPDWIDVESRRVITGMIEMASELLELVVDGPEGDSVWMMYHDRAAEEVIDEGEMEREVTGPQIVFSQS